MNGEKRIGYLAMDNDVPCGIAAGFLDERDPTRAHLVSMWVAPAYRRTGTGSLLVDAVQAWVRTRGVYELRLMVTSSNQGAIAFYERQGFSLTGNTEPYPNDPSLIEYEMSLVLREKVSGSDNLCGACENVFMDKIAMLNEILAQDPNNAFARYGLAMEYAGRGETDTARGIRAASRTAP